MENENTIQPPTPAPVVEQTSPVSPLSPKTSNRLMIIALFLVVIAVVGIGTYALTTRTQPTPPVAVQPTPTPDPTTNWGTYTNEKYGYTIKYPEDWVLNKMPVEGFSGVDQLYSYQPPETQVKDPNFWQGKVKIEIGQIIQTKKKNQTLEQWLVEYENSAGNGNNVLSTKISQEHTKTTGNNAIKETRKFGDGSTSINYFIDRDSNIIFISAIGDLPKYQTVFDQILSTFKFN